MLCLYVQYTFCCELFNVLFSHCVWEQPSGCKLAQGWSSNPGNSAAWEQCWGHVLKRENPPLWIWIVAALLYRTAVDNSFQGGNWGMPWKGFSFGGGLLSSRWNFRKAASVCKSLSCNTFVSVAFPPEVQLFILNTATLFFFLFCFSFFFPFFFQYFFLSTFLVLSAMHKAKWI